MVDSIPKSTSTDQAPRALALKSWILPDDADLDDEYVAASNRSAVLARVLRRRGLADVDSVRRFLDETIYTPADPFTLPNCDKAVERLLKAIQTKEKITVYGDYDVDGVTGTSVLLTVLRDLGANVDFYIPNRSTEGYGLNLKAVSVLASKHRTKLMVTCDCGVSNFAEINLAKSLGVDTLVLDHHTMPEVLPPALAVVHPKLLTEDHPLYNLPGVGVAYKVCEALLGHLGQGHLAASLHDYVTLGMIADLVPLIDENRYLVKIGLPALVKSPRPGIKALLQQVGSKEDTDIVGFGLAPRINAVGRLADASVAVELLTTTDADRAQELAQALERDNARRQALCEQIYTDAEHTVLTTCDLDSDKGIAIYKEGWHHGVVGIVASRLVERFQRPVFIGELDPEEGMIRGSARGVDQIDLYEVLKQNEHLLARWGGHKMAAGFAIEAARGEAACKGIVNACNRFLASKTLRGKVEVDACVAPAEITLPLVRELNAMAPFGMANRKPILYLQNVIVIQSRPLGKEGKHARIIMQDRATAREFEAVMWNTRGRVPADGQAIDLVFNADINNFNNRERLQLVLIDWREHGAPDLDDVAPPVAVAKDVPTPVIASRDLDDLALNARDLVQGLDATGAQRHADAVASTIRLSFKDLRNYAGDADVVIRAKNKLQDALTVYNESGSSLKGHGIAVHDRSGAVERGREHLMLWQYPPNLEHFQALVRDCKASSIYLVGCDDDDSHEASAFLKRLLGLIRYAINQKEGQVEAHVLASVMGTTKMAVALALTSLKQVHWIDWFTEQGVIYLDLLGEPAFSVEETAEYKQLKQVLSQIAAFRQWCAEASMQELQAALLSNRIAVQEADEPDLDADSQDGLPDKIDMVILKDL
ncbi:MAG: single-stranded-DNA-specific exonuclease RecJ [Candidatus Obscuribacterales bacterium]|nr:single-stranded-DNA-specific exonuclease RecJ [Candidatus Obscuribacterales bacterium]